MLIPPVGHTEVTIDGVVKSLDPETRTAVVSIDARCAGKRILGHKATATVHLA